MFAAFLKHIGLMFAFRHDGTGLPSRGPLPWILLTAATVTTGTRGALDLHDAMAAVVFAILGVGVLIFCCRHDIKLLGAIALNCLAGDTVAILMTIYGFPEASMIISGWQIASMLALANKMKKQSEPA